MDLRGGVYKGLFHCTDWLPTIVGGALGRGDVLSQQRVAMDGVDQWAALTLGSSDYPRKELVHHLYKLDADKATNYSGVLRMGDYKLMAGVGDVTPVWKVPTTASVSSVDIESDVEDASWAHSGHYLFNVKEDPTESTDLKLTDLQSFTKTGGAT